METHHFATTDQDGNRICSDISVIGEDEAMIHSGWHCAVAWLS